MDELRKDPKDRTIRVGLPPTDDENTQPDHPYQTHLEAPIPGEVEGEDALPSWSSELSHHSSWAPPDASMNSVPPINNPLPPSSSPPPPLSPSPRPSPPGSPDALEPPDSGSGVSSSGFGSGSNPPASGQGPTDGFDSDEMDGSMLVQGRVLFKKYILEKRLGAGGMGEVWKVHHIELDASRALKFIRTGLSPSPELKKRFRREARVMAKVSHPNAVEIHDAFTAGGMAFIEMAYVPGQSLSEVLKHGRPMPLDWTSRILQQLCEVLDVAHNAGIVHRDLKPANLMLLKDRAPGREFLKVLDFGIAKLLSIDENDGASITNNAPIGTYPYMSPEQFGTATVDTRSDIYTVGVILFEFLTGHRPYSAKNQLYPWLQMHVNEPVPTFRDRNAEVDLPPEVERVVRRCLAKLPEDRPQSALELFEEFDAAAGFLRPPTRTGSSSYATRPVVPATPEPSSPQTEWGYAIDQVEGPLQAPARSHPTGTTQPTSTPRAEGPSATIQARTSPEPAPPVEPSTLSGSYEWSALETATVSPNQVVSSSTAIEPDTFVEWSERRRRPGRRAIVLVAAILIGSIGAGAALLVPWRSAASGFAIVSRGFVWNGNLYDRFENPADLRAVFLPEGYQPKGSEKAEDGWPRVIAREDGPEFIRIAGTTSYKARKPKWKEGDPDEEGRWEVGNPDEDLEREVPIPGFYLQKTEVTNREVARIAAKVRDDPNPTDLFELWSINYTNKSVDAQGENVEADFPAVSLTREGARAVARAFGGVLPGRDQWEFAASSRGARTDYVWGNLSVDDQRTVCINNVGQARRVAASPKDVTEQGVFDMGGNVREWTRDDRQGKPVACGGCFDDPYPFKINDCGIKAAHVPKDAQMFVGLRVVLECPPAQDLAKR